MSLSLKTYLEKNKLHPRPFVGHVGIGSKIEAIEVESKLIIRETIFSQLFLIISLFLFGPGLNLLFFIEREQIFRKPKFILAVVVLFSLIGWIYGLKYFLRMIRNHRIEMTSKGSNFFI